MKAPLPREELERRFLHGLSREWEKALWVLRSADARKMRPPLFSLRDLTGQWGSWSGEKREIALSRNLVLNHSWDAVLEVLHHEMAHQFAAEVLAGGDEPPHGPNFREACRVLRANPRASGKYPPLDERIARNSPNPDDRILHKIRKLFALAQSQNPYEAQSAMRRAHELVAKYNVDLLAQDGQRNFISVFAGRPALRHSPDDYRLAHLLQDFYFIRGIWLPAYLPEREKMGRVLEISGTVANVQLACYVHDFVRRYIQAHWAQYNQGRRFGRSRRVDFAVGIIEGFRSKLADSAAPEKERPRAVVRVEDPQLQAYMAYRYPRTSRIVREGRRQDAQVVRDGRQIGQKMVIAKAVADQGGTRGLLIGH